MITEKYCAFCGVKFIGPDYKKYCSKKCRVNMAGKRYREKNAGEYEKPNHEEPQHRVSCIDEVNKEARSQGLSYGQYKAMQYMQAQTKIN